MEYVIKTVVYTLKHVVDTMFTYITKNRKDGFILIMLFFMSSFSIFSYLEQREANILISKLPIQLQTSMISGDLWETVENSKFIYRIVAPNVEDHVYGVSDRSVTQERLGVPIELGELYVATENCNVTNEMGRLGDYPLQFQSDCIFLTEYLEYREGGRLTVPGPLQGVIIE